MKKLFVSCMIAFMAICSVGAQEVYIGGGFTVGSEDSEFVFQISPEVGCHLTDQWAVGLHYGLYALGRLWSFPVCSVCSLYVL